MKFLRRLRCFALGHRPIDTKIYGPGFAFIMVIAKAPVQDGINVTICARCDEGYVQRIKP